MDKHIGEKIKSLIGGAVELAHLKLFVVFVPVLRNKVVVIFHQCTVGDYVVPTDQPVTDIKFRKTEQLFKYIIRSLQISTLYSANYTPDYSSSLSSSSQYTGRLISSRHRRDISYGLDMI